MFMRSLRFIIGSDSYPRGKSISSVSGANLKTFLRVLSFFILSLFSLLTLTGCFSSQKEDFEQRSFDSPRAFAEFVLSSLVAGNYAEVVEYISPDFLADQGYSKESWVDENERMPYKEWVHGYELVGLRRTSELAKGLVIGNPDYVVLARLTSNSTEPVALTVYPRDLFLFITRTPNQGYQLSFGTATLMFALLDVGAEETDAAFEVLSVKEE